MATSAPVTSTVAAVGAALKRLGIRPGGDIEEILRGLGSLSDRERRHAFVRTAKSVISPRGQRVAATDKLYLAADLPTMLVAGQHDHVIPVEHTRAAGALMPGSKLIIFENSGHFPHLNEPDRFADLLAGFAKDTKPARYHRATAKRRIVEGPPTVGRLVSGGRSGRSGHVPFRSSPLRLRLPFLKPPTTFISPPTAPPRREMTIQAGGA